MSPDRVEIRGEDAGEDRNPESTVLPDPNLDSGTAEGSTSLAPAQEYSPELAPIAAQLEELKRALDELEESLARLSESLEAMIEQQREGRLTQAAVDQTEGEQPDDGTRQDDDDNAEEDTPDPDDEDNAVN